MTPFSSLRPPEPQTVEEVFAWVEKNMRAIKPEEDSLHSIRNWTQRAAIWEGAARRLADICHAQNSLQEKL